MKAHLALILVSLIPHLSVAHDTHGSDNQMPIGYVKYPYQATYYPGDNDGEFLPVSDTSCSLVTLPAVTADSIFSGITTFAKLPWVQCLGKDKDNTFDIAFIGAPFVSQRVSICCLLLIPESGHRDILPTWGSLWTRWYSGWVSPPHVVWGLQRSS